jgi:hypothetical protein
MSEPLPQLLDAKAITSELGVTYAAAVRIMEKLPIVRVDGLRKVYVRRDDVARLILESTITEKR